MSAELNPVAAVRRLYRTKELQRLQVKRELASLRAAQRRMRAQADAETVVDQVLALYAETGDAEAVAAYAVRRGWMVEDDEGQRLMSAADVLIMVEWPEVPGEPTLKAAAQARLPGA